MTIGWGGGGADRAVATDTADHPLWYSSRLPTWASIWAATAVPHLERDLRQLMLEAPEFLIPGERRWTDWARMYVDSPAGNALNLAAGGFLSRYTTSYFHLAREFRSLALQRRTEALGPLSLPIDPTAMEAMVIGRDLLRGPQAHSSRSAASASIAESLSDTDNRPLFALNLGLDCPPFLDTFMAEASIVDDISPARRMADVETLIQVAIDALASGGYPARLLVVARDAPAPSLRLCEAAARRRIHLVMSPSDNSAPTSARHQSLRPAPRPEKDAFGEEYSFLNALIGLHSL